METLQTRGVLGQVKAKVRAEIFAALDDEQVGFFGSLFGVTSLWGGNLEKSTEY